MSTNDPMDEMDGEGEGGDHSFSQLRREYRTMEMNRKAYADESHQTLRRQQTLVDKLRRENEAIKAEINLLTVNSKNKSLTAQQQQLTDLQDQVDQCNQKISQQKQQNEVLLKQINLMRHKILHQRKHMGGVNAAKENIQMVNKQIRILENRLDKALVKFNEALASNKTSRDTIDGLRQERLVFDNIYRKLENELQEKKKEMANVIELSNNAYEQRDNAQLEIAAIEQMSRNEKQDMSSKLNDLDKKIEEAKRIAAAARAEAIANEARGDMTEDEENEMKSKIHKGTWGIAKDKVSSTSSVERVHNFEDAFNKIREATGIHDLNELVTKFIKNEDSNFSLFNYVNEQTNDIEKLEEAIQLYKDEELKYIQEGGDGDNQHRQLLKELEVRLHGTEAAVDKYESKCLEIQKTVNSLKVGIRSIFQKIKCDTKDSSEMLGDVNVVTEANLMQFLGMVEQRTNEILHSYAAYQRNCELKLQQLEEEELSLATTGGSILSTGLQSQQVQMMLGVGPSTPMGQEQIQINPPNLEDYSSDEDTDEEEEDMHPLTRDELKMKTLKGLHKRSQIKDLKRRPMREKQK